MTRRYADRITVRYPDPGAGRDAAGADPVPAWFVWRHRRYRVLQVAGRWVEVGSWWRAAQATDEEFDLWRVEAVAERHRQRGQYDLCRHRGSGRWFLVRAFD